MSGPVHLHPRRPQWPVALAAAMAAVLAGVIWASGGDTPAVPAAPSVPPAPSVPVTRTEAPFPDLPLALVDVTPDGAVIAIASRPATFTRGQAVFPGVVLASVGRDSVTLRFGTQERTLFRPAGAAAVQAPATPEEPAPIDTRQLTSARPQAAQAFLAEVRVRPEARGGFIVESVAPGGRYERMGLRPGDLIYTLDTPAMRAVDEGSMIALMQQTELELDVYRNGAPQRLRVALNADD